MEQRSPQPASFRVHLRFGGLNEDVGRSDFILLELTVTRAEGEVPVPPAFRFCERHEEASPALVAVFEKGDGTSTFTHDVHRRRGSSGGQNPIREVLRGLREDDSVPDQRQGRNPTDAQEFSCHRRKQIVIVDNQTCPGAW